MLTADERTRNQAMLAYLERRLSEPAVQKAADNVARVLGVAPATPKKPRRGKGAVRPSKTSRS